MEGAAKSLVCAHVTSSSGFVLLLLELFVPERNQASVKGSRNKLIAFVVESTRASSSSDGIEGGLGEEERTLGDGEVVWGRNCQADWKVITIQYEQRFFNLNPAIV